MLILQYINNIVKSTDVSTDIHTFNIACDDIIKITMHLNKQLSPTIDDEIYLSVMGHINRILQDKNSDLIDFCVIRNLQKAFARFLQIWLSDALIALLDIRTSNSYMPAKCIWIILDTIYLNMLNNLDQIETCRNIGILIDIIYSRIENPNMRFIRMKFNSIISLIPEYIRTEYPELPKKLVYNCMLFEYMELSCASIIMDTEPIMMPAFDMDITIGCIILPAHKSIIRTYIPTIRRFMDSGLTESESNIGITHLFNLSKPEGHDVIHIACDPKYVRWFEFACDLVYNINRYKCISYDYMKVLRAIDQIKPLLDFYTVVYEFNIGSIMLAIEMRITELVIPNNHSGLQCSSNIRTIIQTFEMLGIWKTYIQTTNGICYTHGLTPGSIVIEYMRNVCLCVDINDLFDMWQYIELMISM